MRIDPRRLLDLLAVARHGSFSAAAEALNVSQPGLSQSIAQLEHGLGGVRLMERDRHGARLTPLGETLAFQARALEAVLARGMEEARLHTAGLAGSLRVGITPVTGASLVPRAVAGLSSQAPGLAISLVEGLDNELLAQLRARELDLVVSRLPVGLPADLANEALGDADWVLITHPDHPLAQRSSVRMADLAGQRWALPAGGSAFRRQMEVVFAAAGLAWPGVGVSSNSVPAIKAIVMAGDCITLMAPDLVAVECAAGRLCARPVVDAAALQPVGVLWRLDDEESPVAARFKQQLRLAASVAAKGTQAGHDARDARVLGATT